RQQIQPQSGSEVAIERGAGHLAGKKIGALRDNWDAQETRGGMDLFRAESRRVDYRRWQIQGAAAITFSVSRDDEQISCHTRPYACDIGGALQFCKVNCS